ncbi:MAG TPA: transglycosylase SLT domain-containing protein [bacterium]|nr:transglycosylase SLT domain-containing protein [bacterium]
MRIIQRFTGITLLAVLGLSAACATAPKRVEKGIPEDHFAEVQRPDIPLVMNDRVQDWMNYFQGKGRPYFERYLARSGRYIPMIRQVLRQNGLPQDLVYLAMIESGFNPHAYSRAAASGTWQFIYQTGIRYGLRVDQWVDERRDPEKSTVAAAKYLKELYDRFNDWYLAAAGYNAGEGKIDRAIKKYATEDFWELSEGKYLRNETKDYVPKLIAAAVLAKDPEKYGFRTEYEKPVLFERAELNRPVDLRVAAKCAGTDYDTLKTLNPELLHWVTPLSGGPYSLKVPAGSKEKFLSALAALPDDRLMGEETDKVDDTTSVRSLAKERDIPVELLAAANGLSPDDTIRGGTKIVIPLTAPVGEEFYEKNYERRRSGGRMIAYRVRKGDNVRSISRKLGVSVAALRDYNPQVNWSRMRAGQKLTIRTTAGKAHYAKNSKKHKGQLALRSKGEKKKSGKVSKKTKRGGASKASVTAPSM